MYLCIYVFVQCLPTHQSASSLQLSSSSTLSAKPPHNPHHQIIIIRVKTFFGENCHKIALPGLDNVQTDHFIYSLLWDFHSSASFLLFNNQNFRSFVQFNTYFIQLSYFPGMYLCNTQCVYMQCPLPIIQSNTFSNMQKSRNLETFNIPFPFIFGHFQQFLNIGGTPPLFSNNIFVLFQDILINI